MTEERITMHRKEIDRLEVIRTVVEQCLGQDTVARQLGLSVPQIKRLVRHCRDQGASGLVSWHRGRRPNNARPVATTAYGEYLWRRFPAAASRYRTASLDAASDPQ